MIAAIRGNTDLIKLLLDFKADAKSITKDGLTAIDLAVLFGQYKAAIYLKQNSDTSNRTVWEAYENRRKHLKLPYVNYRVMIHCLMQNTPFDTAVKMIYKKPQSESQAVVTSEHN